MLPGGGLDDGLVVERQRTLPTRARRRALSSANRSVARALVAGACTSNASPPFSLARRSATAAFCRRRLRIGPVLGEDGDAQTARDRDVAPPDGERRPERHTELLGDLDDIVVALKAGQEENELVPAEARHGVPLAQALLEHRGDAAQEVVAHRTAEGFVDAAKAVEAEEHDRELGALPPRVDDAHGQAIVEDSTRR